jgi:hypothetical protein
MSNEFIDSAYIKLDEAKKLAKETFKNNYQNKENPITYKNINKYRMFYNKHFYSNLISIFINQ